MVSLTLYLSTHVEENLQKSNALDTSGPRGERKYTIT